jgi:hypothetical protein
MTTVNNEFGLKVVVCAMAAVALTVMSGWTFVESTSTAPGVNAANVTESLGEIVISSARQVAQNTAAVLVD